jgi:hypothetical protein
MARRRGFVLLPVRKAYSRKREGRRNATSGKSQAKRSMASALATQIDPWKPKGPPQGPAVDPESPNGPSSSWAGRVITQTARIEVSRQLSRQQAWLQGMMGAAGEL